VGNVRALSRTFAPDAVGGLIPWSEASGYHVRQLAETWQDVMDRRAEAHGITVTQWRYPLRELWEEERVVDWPN